jgi:hypothetical protein
MRVGVALACSLGLLASCARSASPPPSAPARSAALPSASTARHDEPRLFPPTQGPGTNLAGVDRDGSRRLLALGLRVVEHPDGSLEVGDELLPAARSARFLELPERLGGGFLFWIVTSSATLLYRAPSWTAKLEPLVQMDFEVERFVAGFDRLLVLPRREGDYRALDLETGKPVPPLGLPLAPAYGAMAFVDGWFGAVQVPLRGTLLSFDAGGSWHPLALPVTALAVSDGTLALTTPSADYSLGASGVLSQVAERDAARISEAAQAELQRAVASSATLSGRGPVPLLQTAALSGFPDGRGAAFVASGGTLSKVTLDTGRVLERREHAYAGAAECQGVRLGAKGVGFVCGQGRELTRVYRVTEPLGLQSVLELSGARVVSDSGSGALVIRGGCRALGGKLAHCILLPNGQLREVTSQSERDRVVALADGRVAILTPPTAGSTGSLQILGSGPAQRVALSVLRREPRHKLLLEQGVWLDGMTEIKPGILQGWVVGAGPFAGFTLALDGKLTLHRIQDNAARALFAGPRALALGENGLAAESTDGGADWQGVELPPELDLKALGSSGMRQGCSAIGCSFAGFTRIGYFAGRSAKSLAQPAAPPRVSFAGPGGSRWILHCAPTGEVSAAALPVRPATPLSGRRLRSGTRGPGEEQELPPLSPLLDQPAPALAENQQGVDAGTEPYGIQVRVYAYGPRGSDWTKTGSLMIAFADRFSVKPGVRLTATARSPWPDVATAADALGAEPSTSAAGLAAALDPAGSAGALLLSSRGTVDLFAFEAGRVPTRLPNVARLGIAARFSGVVKTKTGFFLGSYDENNRAFRIYRLAGQDLEVALEVTDIPPPRGASSELVRSAAGDALGILVRGTGWFVHPVDLEAGVVDAPYQITPAQLASLPAPCAEGAEGFLVTSGPGLDPYATELPAGMSARSFEGRFRVSALGICTDELAAQGEGGPTAGARNIFTVAGAGPRDTRQPHPTVDVTLSERKPLGRRIGLRCSN